MLKAVFAATAVAITFATPATAQMMCGPGQQAQTSSGGGMMCGAPMGAAQAEQNKTEKPQMSGMCPCCRMMAGMMRRGGGGMMHHDMPGVETPKQQ